MDMEQSFQISDVLLPLSAAVLIVMAFLLRWLCKAANVAPESLVGVKPSPMPFLTRAEFVAARLNMDLDEWLDRAYVTPEIVKWRVEGGVLEAREKLNQIQEKIKPPFLSPFLEIPEEKGKFGVTLDRLYTAPALGNFYRPWYFQPGPGPCSVGLPGALGVSGGPGVSGLGVGVDGGSRRSVFRSYQVLNGLPVKNDFWYRVKSSGKLGLLKQVSAVTGMGTLRLSPGKFFTLPMFDMEFAIPRAGENWVFKPCARHGRTWVSNFTVEKESLLPQGDAQTHEQLRCGCLVPFEFVN